MKELPASSVNYGRQSNIFKESVMIKHLVVAISALFLLAVNLPARSDASLIPLVRVFPSSAGDVTFQHQTHIQERGIQCTECHHQINAKKLETPHPDYFKQSWIKCRICHNEEAAKGNASLYSCTACHRTNTNDIADETLSAKVVVHKQCWKCHVIGTGKDASAGCKKCHSAKQPS